jgi:hypothetical protein
MARTVFRRPDSTTDDISVTKSTEPRPQLFDPGSYDVEVTEARLVTSRRSPGNVSVALKLRLPDSGTAIDTQPMWIAGPRAGQGPLASRNQRIIEDLLACIGIEEDTFTNAQLAQLVGKTFAVELSLDQSRLGTAFNTIAHVAGLVVPENEPTVLPFRSGSAAE